MRVLRKFLLLVLLLFLLILLQLQVPHCLISLLWARDWYLTRPSFISGSGNKKVRAVQISTKRPGDVARIRSVVETVPRRGTQGRCRTPTVSRTQRSNAKNDGHLYFTITPRSVRMFRGAASKSALRNVQVEVLRPATTHLWTQKRTCTWPSA